MTASAVGPPRSSSAGASSGPASGSGPGDGQRPLLTTGAIAAAVVTAAGLAAITLVVLLGWIAAPHQGAGLPGVLRTAAALWLVGHHVGFTFHGAGRIGLLPLGLVLLPGALLWRAGRWVVRAGRVRRLRHVGYAAISLAVPYALLTGALALASRSALESSSLPQSVIWGFLLSLVAAGLGGARALAPWSQLIRLLPERPRSVVVGMGGALGMLAAFGALLAGISLAVHLHQAAALQQDLDPGVVGTLLLLLLQIAYLPNAVVWAIAFTLGPGFAFGTATVVAPTGSALLQLPAFPILAALPPGLHAAIPGWIEPTVLALPYLAGCLGGLLLVRAAPALSLDGAPLWGLACGAASGLVLGVLAAVSGGPLGDGRLAAVGPSAWQTGLVSALEIGIAAAVTAGLANYLSLRRAGLLPSGPTAVAGPSAGARRNAADPAAAAAPAAADGETGHVIYIDPWAGEPRPQPRGPAGPAALPDRELP